MTYRGIVRKWLRIPVEPIVEEAAWTAAQQKLAQGQALAARHSKHFYLVGRAHPLLLRLCSDGCAGESLSLCDSRFKNTVERCTLPQFSAKAVDQTIWNYIETSLDRDRILAGIHAQHGKPRQPRTDTAGSTRLAYEAAC